MFSLEESGQVVADINTALLLEEMDRSVSLMPGARAILSWIGESDYPAALVTSSDLNYAITYLNKLGIADSFEQIVTAEDVMNGKPDPEPYLVGAQGIEKDPGSCIVLEDSVNGVLAGKASGATVIAVPSTKSDREQMGNPDYVVSSLIEALEVVRGMGL